MRKRKACLLIFVLVLLLFYTAKNQILLPVGQAASETFNPPLNVEVENGIYLPLVNRNRWPSACYAPGTENYQVPSPDIPDITLQQGTTITVTTNTDVINGDISGVQELITNPGPDGIALREAIEATNADSGEYTIRFSPSLDGAAIFTGQDGSWDLPPLLGGSLIINGDIDGDQHPDIKIANTMPLEEHPFGFIINNSAITLHALEMEGYFNAVTIKPTATDTTYANITISNMVMSDVLVGINLHAGPDEGALASNNQWENILLINNDMDVQQDGITIDLNNTIGDHMNNVTVSNNTIHIMQGISDSFGIQFMAGFWDGSDNNGITNVIISGNTIQGNPVTSIGILSGAIGGKGNIIDRVSILGNEILISDPIWTNEAGFFGIVLVAGDGSTEYADPNYDPVGYPEFNTLRNVDIIANKVEGFGVSGIAVGAGNMGARHNTIENVSILDNQIHTFIPDIEPGVAAIHIQSGDGWPTHHTTENLISHIIVQNNSVYLGREEGLPDFGYDTDGAVKISGGESPGADRNQVHDFWITLNEVDSVIPGIHLLGGGYNNNENVINTGNVRCNTIVRNPQSPQRDPPLKGIILTGGGDYCTLNRVENIHLYYNDVAGIWNDRTVSPNLHDTAINNVVDYTATP